MWPKDIKKWIENKVLYISIPFTWLLPKARAFVLQISNEWNSVIVGGPATALVPGFFSDLDFVEEGGSMPGVLQRINPQATRTTIGCIRACPFCGVSKIEPEYMELEKWESRPVLMDNNILAASQPHFDKVCDDLERWEWCDFNQGIDARLLTEYHAERFKRIGRPVLRLALDYDGMLDVWMRAWELLRSQGISKRLIMGYVLCGFNDTPESAWRRCNKIDSLGCKALPMWFHELDAMKPNAVTEKQTRNGWTDYERRRIMQWFYKHKKAVVYK